MQHDMLIEEIQTDFNIDPKKSIRTFYKKYLKNVRLNLILTFVFMILFIVWYCLQPNNICALCCAILYPTIMFSFIFVDGIWQYRSLSRMGEFNLRNTKIQIYETKIILSYEKDDVSYQYEYFYEKFNRIYSNEKEIIFSGEKVYFKIKKRDFKEETIKYLQTNTFH